MSEILVILNPAARSTRAGSFWKTIGELPGNATIATTSQAGEAKALAAQAVKNGFRTIVAAGGDGTVNEVVNGLAGSDATLGVLPVGTMNVFATELGLPSKLKEAWRVILDGHTRKIDLARANRQYFIQLAGIGLDAQVVKETSWEMKKSFGPISYLVSAAQIAARKPPRLIAEANGTTVEGSFVLIGNGRYYGGPVQFFSEAQIDDGLLDVLVFQKMGHLDIVRYMGTVLFGRHTSLPDVLSFQTRKLTVQCDEEVPVELDGELSTTLPVTFRIASRKLRVLAPKQPAEP